jgi:glycogen debranching enzyme
MTGAPPNAAALGAPIGMAQAVGYAALPYAQEAPTTSTLALKHDRVFLVATLEGDIVPPGSCSLGLFHDDTRILSHYALRVCGGPPSLLSAEVPRTYTGQVDLAVKDLPFGGRPWDPKHAVHIRREFLLSDRLTERVTLTSYLPGSLEYWVELVCAADFADIFEVRGWSRDGRGEFFPPQTEPDCMTFSYRGRDGRLLRTVVGLREPPAELGPGFARWRFVLEHQVPRRLEWEVALEGATTEAFPATRGLERRRTDLENLYRGWRADGSRWATDVPKFDVVLRRATDDLRALYIDVDGGNVVSAGIPWYSTVFGRDAIITSLQTLSLNPRLARDALRYLARRQGVKEDAFTEEEPGKIMHELRRGEMARSGEIPHVPYFGTVDATPLWLVLLHETWRWTGDAELVRELLPNAERALAWIDRYGDVDGDGFVEYARHSAKGLVNQGWKDSADGVPWPDGALPEPPIALVEVQGYVHDAKTRMADLLDAFGECGRAGALRDEAAAMQTAIREKFWLEDLGTFALALDGAKRPLPTVASNAGHLLWSRVPTAEQAARLAGRLLAADLFSGWGIRTLSALHPAFNPMSYHNGSVWPHDNAIAVLGLALYGKAREALPIVRALHEAAVRFEFQRLPELFCGLARERGVRAVRYPVSCSPQAWASGAFFMVLQAMLGLFPEAPAGVLHVRNPVLPDFLEALTVSGLRVGRSRVSLQFRRHGDRTLANLLALSGAPLQVRIELT